MGVTAPDGPNTKQKADYEKMSKMSGPQFDRDFATHMVTDHQKDFAEYKKASKSADAAGEYAKGNIPVLQKRDRKVVSLKEVLEQIGSVSSPTTRFDPGFGRKCGDAPAANGHCCREAGKEQKGSAAIGMLVVEREAIRWRNVGRGKGFAPALPGPAGGFVMDAFDRFWQWADKPPESLLTIPAELYRAVMDLAAEHRRGRAPVNQAAARVPDPE